VDDFFLPRQINPPSNFEFNDEEQGVSKKEKKGNETTTVTKIARSFTFSINSGQPTQD